MKDSILEEVLLPKNVSVEIENSSLLFKGPKGEFKKHFKSLNVKIKKDGEKIIIATDGSTKREKKIVGTFVAHIKNMIMGVTDGHKYVLKICSGHFPMNVSVSGNNFIVKNFLGEKIPRILKLKSNAKVLVEGEFVNVESLDKELAGLVSAGIEQLTKRSRYDTRIYQDGIYIISKDGKELK